MAETLYYDPGQLFTSLKESPTRTLIILNQPITSKDVLRRLWKTCAFRICVDGGANRLFELLKDESVEERLRYLPQRIHGDLDSIDDYVREWFIKHNVLVTKNPSEYSTDFGKAMEIIRGSDSDESHAHATLVSKVTEILILSTIAGRVDHGVGILGELLREQLRTPSARLWFVSECSVTFWLEGGNVCNNIAIDLQAGIFKRNVGILPIGRPAVISTKGLEWDVENWETSMGGQVSTSNHVVNREVCVWSDERVLFTVERAEMLPQMRE